MPDVDETHNTLPVNTVGTLVKADTLPVVIEEPAADNETRPDFLHGFITLPATKNHPERQYDAGSGGKKAEYPSIPYGTYAINGMRKSPHIGKYSGDDVVFNIENMFDEKVDRERAAMLLHKATVWNKPVSKGCIVIVQKQYAQFREHMKEVLKEYGDLVVCVAPVAGSEANAAFTVKKADEAAPTAAATVRPAKGIAQPST